MSNTVLNWVSQADFWIPNLIFGLILIFFLGSWFSGKITEKLVNISLIIVFSIFILKFLVFAVLFYYRLKLDPSGLGKLLLPPQSNFYYQNLIFTGKNYLTPIVSALLFFIFLWLLHRRKSQILDKIEAKLGFFGGLVVGFPHILVFIVLTFLLTLSASIYQFRKGKNPLKQRVSIAPFILISAILVLLFQVPIAKFMYSVFKLA